MRDRVDACDWSVTNLGARNAWSAELASAVQQVLDSHFPMALVWGPGLTTIYNDAFRPILGDKEEALGRSFSDIWSEAWSDIGPIAEKALAGQSTYIENFPLVVDRGNGPEQCYFTFCYSPLRLADGTVCGMMDTVIETTQTMETRQRLHLAGEELVHRLKNSLAMVQAMASQTLRHHAEPGAYRSFEQRLSALSTAHEVLRDQGWETGCLAKAVSESLVPHLPLERTCIEGENVEIGPQTTMSLSMMLHELATNAVKHGSMSVEDGRVDIRWCKAAGRLNLEWREYGGPIVTAPETKGFGSRLLSIGLGSASGSKLHFEPEGLRFEVSAPLAILAR